MNCRDAQRKNVVNNVDMSGLRKPWQMARTHKKTHRTAQKHAEHQDATDIHKKLFLYCVCFCVFKTRP